VFQKRRHFYFCENLAKYLPISIIFGSSTPEEICNKNMHAYPPHLFTVLILYLVKLWSTYLCVPVHCFKKWPFTVCNKFVRCHPSLIIFGRPMSEEFCEETFVTQPTKAGLHVATVCNLVKQATILRACQTLSLSKVKQ